MDATEAGILISDMANLLAESGLSHTVGTCVHDTKLFFDDGSEMGMSELFTAALHLSEVLKKRANNTTDNPTAPGKGAM